ncbi:Fe-S cluster assembly protein SufD [Sodaliphilus pleomorphus]|uniref:Fe-S cluster assembly protein SufD n=1 Tax=Sodaliphilus pleomorphus TaxID=2606626 RepID=UPI00240907FA|nr:Fe-S cluster assembly protein SufD [Sodaliphilus pleomorphus]MDD6687252.1 Fe-S cluster assembly protein SufD [Sodaliphilus pleomorphus]
MTALKQYIDLYTEHRAAIEAHAPAALNALRPAALKALDGARLPRKGEEDYEGTDLEQAFAPDYGVNVNRTPFTADPGQAFSCDVPNMSTCLYFFYNDIFSPSRTARQLPGGVVVESLAQAQHSHPEILAKYLGSLADLSKPEVALNTLLAQDGMLVYIPDGVTAEKPIQLVNIYNAAAPVMAVRRLLVVVGENAHAKMLVCDHTQNAGVDYLGSQVVEIVALKDATFDYYDLEETNASTHRVSSVFVDQREGSNVLVDGMTLLNGFTRNDYYVNVDGEHCQTQLLGMTIASGTQHVDNHSLLCHNKPNCHSNEMFKYVLNDEAVGAFAGKILVKPGCPKTDAYQGNRNIVAAPTAKMYSKPQLEIYTDDVQCSHGTAIGQLDEEALFYMRTRGIPLDQARMLLMQAFVDDVIDGVRLDALKDRLRHLVEKRFQGKMAMCQACAGNGCNSKIETY